MDGREWQDGFGGAVTVCDRDFRIIYMNAKARETFAKWGGDIVGRSLLDCHSEASRERIRAFMASGTVNTYTIEKGGKRKLIHQAPWYRDGAVAGLVELSIELPEGMAHHKRD